MLTCNFSLSLVYFNLPNTCGQPDIPEPIGSKILQLPVSVGQNIVIWGKVPVSGMFYIQSPKGLLFDCVDGKLKNNCPKCIYENSSVILKNIQPDDSGLYYIKDSFTGATWINISVTAVTELTTPSAPPQAFSVGNGTSLDQPMAAKGRSRYGFAVIGAGIIVAVIVCWKWQNIRRVVFPTVSRGQSCAFHEIWEVQWKGEWGRRNKPFEPEQPHNV
ncbi:hypothetical protein XENTR_v10020168 [Xenopus tropicalis]|nr:hypothetical protein XENTR_v10020168 [Xenopus tropicalis]